MDDDQLDDIPDLESVWSDGDEESGNSATTDGDDPLEGMRIHVYDQQRCRGPRTTKPTLGTPLEERAAERLSGICYPGDDPNSLSTFADTRFIKP